MAANCAGIRMKPPPFSYHDPSTVAEAVGLLVTLENAKVLAGGQSLMPMLNMRFVLPDHVIDLNRIDGLSYIRDSGDSLDIGAMTRQREIEFSDVVRLRCPLMREAILNVGHRQTRNRGTLGGSLCHLDPSAELVLVAAAMDAVVTIAGRDGERTVAFADFPQAYMTPAVGQDELLTSVRFPLWPEGHGYAFMEFARRHGDFAIVSAAALLHEDSSGRIAKAAVAVGGVGAAPVRVTEIERAVIGHPASADLFRDACEACRRIEAMEDVHASSSYRQHLAAVLSRRALEAAHGRISKGTDR
jgi:aerobic carbon-monoxide dehydrogenase medium subunit